MIRLISLVLLSALPLYAQEYDLGDIKVFCDCDNKNSWHSEKISKDIAKQLFQNCTTFKQNCEKEDHIINLKHSVTKR